MLFMENINKLLSLELMKFFAILMITNSHFQLIYKDYNIGFATLGVHGNALFFFVSGYLLTMGLQKKVSYFGWLKTRIKRVVVPLLVISLMVSYFFDEVWLSVFLSKQYWFIHCIIGYYFAFYWIAKVLHKKESNVLRLFLYFIIVVVSLAIGVCFPVFEGSIFHSHWHYFCHLSIMVLGGIVFLNKSFVLGVRPIIHIMVCVVTFIAYFFVISIGKGHNDYLYYLQMLAIIPLHIFCITLFGVLSNTKFNKVQGKKIIRPFLWISSLSLEVYLVQFYIITDRYNSFFPLSIIMMFMMIFMVAYCYRILLNIITIFFTDDSFIWKRILSL